MHPQLQISLKEHHSQPTTPERDFALWVMADCKGSILPNPKVLPLFRNFLHVLSLSYKVVSIQEKWCTDRWNSSGQKQWKGMNELLKVLLTLWTLQVIHGSQPPTLYLCCGSWDKQWLQEPLGPFFIYHLQKLDLLGNGVCCCIGNSLVRKSSNNTLKEWEMME